MLADVHSFVFNSFKVKSLMKGRICYSTMWIIDLNSLTPQIGHCVMKYQALFWHYLT